MSAELVVLAVKGNVAQSALELALSDNLAGKVVIDVTNPIADDPPVNGVLRFFTGPNESFMERRQNVFSASRQGVLLRRERVPGKRRVWRTSTHDVHSR